MATRKTTPPKPALKIVGGRKSSANGPARQRSLKVADEISAGTRPKFMDKGDTGKELPENATPLDVLVMAMRRAFFIGGSIYAAPYAEKAAPYLHAKISSIELKNPMGLTGASAGKPMPFLVEFVDPQDPE